MAEKVKESKYIWVFGLATTIAILIIPLAIFIPQESKKADPWDNVPAETVHTDHSQLMQGPYETGSDVTRACLACHQEAGHQMLESAHWRWESDPVYLEERGEAVATGKKNTINNFCIGVQGNWPSCTSCHTGYGWGDADFDFSNQDNIDCLVCHDTSGTYAKSKEGYPAEGVDLAVAAQSVGSPTRETCGSCHFKGGGGNAVKHGDLDESLYFPTERIDVHMGRYDFQCITCHQTDDHQIRGRSISVSVDNENQAACTDCHSEDLHDDDRITAHIDSVACQTCHIPTIAKQDATKVDWDWSAAGDDEREEDPHEYLKIKGSFAYEKDLEPDYAWYNGTAYRYLLGDKINPSEITPINLPKGSITDATAKIWPFKIHTALQIYDTEYNYFLQPKTVGEGGYWTEFDWDLAARLGAEAADMEYSGHYGFAPSEMHWPTTHMVSPAEDALQCVDCHSENGRMDWRALGYEGDPAEYGGRKSIINTLTQNMAIRGDN